MGILNKLFGKKPQVKTIAGLRYLTPTQQAIFLSMNSGDGVDVFNKLWVAYKCITMIGENVSTLPVDLVDVKGDAVEDKITQSFINNPNPLDTYTDMIEQFSSYYVLNGNAYIKQVDGLNSDYWVLMSQNVTPIKGDPAKSEPPIKGYKDASNSKEIIYPSDQIIHMKSFNPASRISGISRLQAGMGEIKFAELVSDYKNNLYDNQATPSGVLYHDGNLTDQQFEELKKMLKENHAGTRNAGESLLLEAGLKWEKMGFSPADLNIIKSESMTEGKIASLLGVPPEMLNLAEQKNYANYREARRAFYEETILPIGKKINAVFNKFFYPDGSRHFKIQRNEIDALRLLPEEIDKMWWITPNNRRTLDGFEPMVDKAMDRIYIPANFIDINFVGGEDNNNL